MPFSTEGTRGSVAEGIGRFFGEVFPVQSGSGVFSRGLLGGDRLQGIIGGRGGGQGFYYPAQMVRRLLGRRAGVGSYQDVVSQFTPDTEGVITRAVAGRLDPLVQADIPREGRLSVREQNRRAYQLLTAREQYVGEYTPEVSELETRLYDMQAAGALDTEGLEELAGIHTRLAEIQRPLTTEGGIDAEIRSVLGPDTPTDIGDIDPSVYTRSYQVGQRLQDTGLGRGLRGLSDTFSAARSARGVGTTLRWAGKLGKLVPPGFEILDFMDKVDYFTGGSTRRITQEAVETGDLDTILSRYELLQKERAFHTTGGGLDVVGRLLGSGITEFEEDYFKREGGLRDIGSLWSGLEWAERLPVIDPFLTAVDKIEKGIGGRVFDTVTDPTGRLVTSEVDVQMGQLQELLTYKRGALTRGQQERLDTALTGQRAALTTELSGLPAYDREQVAQRRADIESEIQRINESEDKMVRVVGGMGDSFVAGAVQFRSKTARLKELGYELGELPDARAEELRQNIAAIDVAMGVTPEPVIPQQLQERELPRIGPITPLTEALPRIGPITPLTRPEPIVVPGKGITIERPAPYTGAVTPLTEALTGAEREAEMARRMGFVEEQAVAATEDITEPARMALADRLPAIHVGPGHTRERGYMGGDRFEQGREGWVYRMPEIGVVDQRPGVTPAVTPTAPYTAPSAVTPAVTPTVVTPAIPGVAVTEPVLPPQVQEREPVVEPAVTEAITEAVTGATLSDTSMGMFRGMEQTDLNKQAYIILKDLEQGVIDGDTLKGMLFAPSLGIHGEEEKIRYLGFDSAETKPRDMQRYQLSRKHRTEEAVSTETKRGKEATKMHKEFLEQFKVGDEYHVPLVMDEFQERGKYGRVLAPPLGAKDTYFKQAIEAGVARVYGSTAFLGGESTLYERQDTVADIEKAKRHYARVDDDILRDARDQVYGQITAPAFTMRDRFAGMGETYTQAGLIGTGVDGDFGIVGEAARDRAQSQANLETYQQQIQQQQVLLDTERDKFRRGDALEPSVEQSERVKALQEQIQLAEKAAEAEQRAIKEYTRVIDQSSKLVQNMRKELLQSKIALLKDERAVFQQTQKEEFTAIQDEIKEQNRLRQGFGKEVLGDVGFMTRFETDFRGGLTGEVGGVTADLTGVQAEIEAQQGVVEGSRSAWQTAFEAFEQAPGKETGDALALAEDAFNAEKANLQHLKAMEQLYSRKLTLLEAGIQTSENASAASKIIAEQLELQAQALAARQSAGMLADTFDIIGEGRQDLREEGRFSLKGYASVSPDITMLSDVREWAASSREMLGEDKLGTELRLKGITPEFEGNQKELSDLRDELKAEMESEAPDYDRVAELSAEIENKQKIVDTQQKIVDDYKAQLEKINAQLENIQKQVDAHKDAIGTKIAEQSYAASVRDIKDDETTMKELLKTPYADYTDEQKADLQKFLQVDQGDVIPEHVEGFRESFIVAQAKGAMRPDAMLERYEDMSLEQLQAQLDPETGEFVGLSGKQAKLADARLKEVISPEAYIELHEQRQAAFAQTPEGVLKQTLKDRTEAEREVKRQQRLAERRREYAERQELREDKRHIDMVSKPLVQLPGRFFQAFDRRSGIERTGRQRLTDLRESVGEQKRDVMEDANLTIRQRQQQIERIEKESAKRRIKIEQDIAEAKKKAFADVLDSFKNMFRDMLIRETEYMAQSAIREWWLGRQGWENDQMGGYQRATPGGGGSFPISVNIPTGNAPVRSDTGRTYVGSPTGATGGGQVVLPMGPMAAGDGGQPIRSPAAVGSGVGNDGRFYAKDGRIFPDEESYKRQMEKEGQPDRGGGFDIARNLFTLGTHQLAEEHLWSRWDDPDTGDRPWWATAGQWGKTIW